MKAMQFPSLNRIRRGPSLAEINLDIVIALLPCAFWAFFLHGAHALLLMGASVVVSMAADAFVCTVIKKDLKRMLDLSCIVNGLIIALMAPATASLVSVAALSFVAAILSRAFTAIEKLPFCIPAAVLSAASLFMKEEFTQFPAVSGKFDGEAFAHGVYPITALIAETTPDNQWYELFFGSVCGPMGAVSVLLIIAGAVYLLVRRIASLKVAASFMAGCAVCAYFVTGSANPFEVVLYTCLTGQFLFGAVFLASLPAWRVHDGRFDILLPAIGGALAVYLAFNVTLLSVPIAVLAMGLISSVIKLLPPSQPPFGSA